MECRTAKYLMSMRMRGGIGMNHDAGSSRSELINEQVEPGKNSLNARTIMMSTTTTSSGSLRNQQLFSLQA